VVAVGVAAGLDGVRPGAARGGRRHGCE
jgi:hypothetical protein